MDKQKRTQVVALLTEYRCEVKAELDSIDTAIQAMSENEAPRTKMPDNGNIWLNMTVQEAILAFLERHSEKAYRASEIKRFLRKKKVPGFNKKSFAAMVATSVRRIAGKGNAVQTTVNIKGREVAAFKYKNEHY